MKNRFLGVCDHNRSLQKGVSLIIVIFALVIFAGLGWTLFVLQTSDFDANIRSLESERALGIAEAGAQWGVMALEGTFDCDSINATTFPHSFAGGEYSVSCSGSRPELFIESTGYVPSQSDFIAQRTVMLSVTEGGFLNCATVKELLDWSDLHTGSAINGNIIAGEYNGNDVDPTNEEEDKAIPGVGQRFVTDDPAFPDIIMDYFKTIAQGYDHVEVCGTAQAASNSGGNVLRVIPNGFFTDKEGYAVRNLTHGTWADSDWAVIESVTDNGKEVTLDRVIDNDWDGDYIRIVKRFTGSNNNQKIWYVDATDIFGEDTVGGDIIVDLRDAQAIFNHTTLIAEGDIVFRGEKSISMLAYVDISINETYPNVATEDGNIYFVDVPAGSNENQRCTRRSFDGLIFSENGDVYIQYLNGVSVMSNNLTLDGLVKLNYVGKYVDTLGFLGAIAVSQWTEQ